MVQSTQHLGFQSGRMFDSGSPFLPHLVHTLHMSKPVITFVFKVLRNGLLRYMLYTCPNLRLRSCSKCYATDGFGTYFTHVPPRDNVRVQSATHRTASVRTLHVQTRDNVRVQSATQRTASVHAAHMSKPAITFVFKVLRNGLLRYILYTCPTPVRVQSATHRTASVRTLHMSKPVITFVFKVLRNGLLWYVLYTCPNP